MGQVNKILLKISENFRRENFSKFIKLERKLAEN